MCVISQAIKAETDGLREELEIVRTLGADLIFACGETEKPEVKKTIDEVRAKTFKVFFFFFLSHWLCIQKHLFFYYFA